MSDENTNQTPAPETPTAQAAPPAAPEAPVTPLPATPPIDDVADAMRIGDMLTTDMNPKPAKKAKAPKADAPPSEPAAPAVTPAAPAAATPAPEPPKPTVIKKSTPKPTAPQQMTPEEIARLSAQAASDVVKSQMANQQPAAEELPEEVLAAKPIYDELEKVATKYKGIASKVAKFQKAELSRADAWEAQNPGKAYNADDDEHADWYAKNRPAIDPEDWAEAKFEMQYQKRRARDIDPTINETKQELQRLKAEPSARATVNQFASHLYSGINPEGQPTPDEVKKWADANPFVAEVASEAGQATAPVVEAVSMLWDDAVKFDDKSDTHKAALGWFQRMESELSGANHTDEDGRTWVPADQYAKLPAAQKAKHITTTKDALVRYIGLSVAEMVKKSAAEKESMARKYAERFGLVKQNASTLTQTPAAQTPQKPALQQPSPSVGAGSATPPASGVAPDGKAQSGSFIDRMLVSL